MPVVGVSARRATFGTGERTPQRCPVFSLTRCITSSAIRPLVHADDGYVCAAGAVGGMIPIAEGGAVLHADATCGCDDSATRLRDPRVRMPWKT